MAFLAIAPTGTVLPFAGTTAPEGWVLCNSGEYLKTSSAYEKLFAVIGIAFGETNGSGGAGTTHFRVPDMRGVFPRGSGTNATANYGGVTGHTPAGGSLAAKNGQKTAKNGLSNAASSLSALTLNASGISGTAGGQSLGTTIIAVGGSNGEGYGWFGVNAAGASGNTTAMPAGGNYRLAEFASNLRGNIAHTHAASSISGTAAAQTVSSSTVAAQTVSSTDTETTPASLALNYIIKL